MKRKDVKWPLFILWVMVALHGWSQKAHVYNANTNVVWKGIVNKIGLSVDGNLKDVLIYGGRLEYSEGLNKAMFDSAGDMNEWKYMQDSGYMLIVPDCDARVVDLVVEYFQPNGEWRSETWSFRPIHIDTPEVIYQGKRKDDTLISKSQMLAGINSSISLTLDPSSLNEGVAFECIEFEVDITHDRKTQTFRCNGNQFSGAALKAMEKMDLGDRLVIRDVQTITPCGIKKLNDRLELTIN